MCVCVCVCLCVCECVCVCVCVIAAYVALLNTLWSSKLHARFDCGVRVAVNLKSENESNQKR